MSRTWIAAILIVAVGLHTVAFCLYSPGDAFVWLIPWWKDLHAHGIGAPVGNYAPPYLYLLWLMSPLQGLTQFDVMFIKALSVAGALWLTFASCVLLKALDRSWQLGLLAFALPSVISNTSVLAQADTFWVAPCLLAVAASIRGEPVKVAAWAGFAFAVKMQAAWLAPFVIYYLVTARAKPIAWLAAPAAFALAWLPAWMAGWPVSYLSTIYLGQTTYVPRKGPYTENGASIWTLVAAISKDANFALRWLGVPLAGATVTVWLSRLPRKPNPEQLLIAALVSAAVVPFFLPLMHERFFMLADVLAFAYAAAFPTRRNIVMAAAIQIASAWPVFVWAFVLQPAQLIAPPLLALALFELGRQHGAQQQIILGTQAPPPPPVGTVLEDPEVHESPEKGMRESQLRPSSPLSIQPRVGA